VADLDASVIAHPNSIRSHPPAAPASASPLHVGDMSDPVLPERL